ncbi:MAG TPA: chorismate synthase [Candidatus Wallbacteria bacterium]|nr:chorismate synthase [Candidatus Wallbacteria bacterium]
MSNTFGEIFKVTTFGESHGAALGVVIDGCPGGLPLFEKDISSYLAEDKKHALLRTKRTEPNEFQILSGVYKNKALGTPIAMIVYNKDADSSDYLGFEGVARPSHAEFGYYSRYGIYDPRGGGRASGRECISRHLAAAVASKILSFTGIKIEGRLVELYGIDVTSAKGHKKALEAIENIREEGDSTGGVFEVTVKHAPAGLGGPVFNKLDSLIASYFFSIGGICGVETGAGFATSKMKGSSSNDSLYFGAGKKLKSASNNSGGINGGISNGMDIIARAAVRPTPSIYKTQKTIDFYKGKNTTLKLDGRFDVNFTPRAMSAALSMMRILMADMLLSAGYIHPTKFKVSGC